MIRILTYGEVEAAEIFARVVPEIDVEATVADIIATVRKEGDKALLAYCEKFDGAVLSDLQVSQEEINEAVAQVEPRFLEILEKAAETIRAFLNDHDLDVSLVVYDREAFEVSSSLFTKLLNFSSFSPKKN